MHSNKVESLNNLTIPNYENLRENFVELISYILESSVNEDNDLSKAINEKRVDMKKMINNNSQLKLILKDFTNIWNKAYELMIQRTNKAFQIIPEVPFYSFDEILDEEFFPRITMATKDKKTYFGLKIKNEDDFFGVLESDIKKLPFYNFWKTKVIHTKIYSKNGKAIEDFVSLESWENFSKHFIEDGLSYCSN